jgi:hypothetical protein
MGDYFTRETWRAGGRSKLRKRVNGYAGCKVAPPAFLAAAKIAAFKPGRPGYRTCAALKRDGTPCGRLALRELKVCEAHGGFQYLARQGKLQSSGRTAAFRAAALEGRSHQAPLELARMPLYQAANQRVRMKMARAWGTPGWPGLVRQVREMQSRDI